MDKLLREVKIRDESSSDSENEEETKVEEAVKKDEDKIVFHKHEYLSGKVYEGEWRNGKPHGLGKMASKEKTIVGKWVDGEIRGVAVTIENNGPRICEDSQGELGLCFIQNTDGSVISVERHKKEGKHGYGIHEHTRG